MKRLVPLVLLVLSPTLFAEGKYSITAIETISYRLTLNGFVKYDLPNDSWELDVEDGAYNLLVPNGRVLMENMIDDENVLVLKQPSKLSGYRIFTFFKKTHKFSISETDYTDFSAEELAMGYMKEDISVSLGNYNIH